MAPRDVVLVYDASCGACGEIARRASEIFVCPVLLRSCRDPNLAAEFPPLRLGRRPCRRPVMLVREADGECRVLTGLALWRSAASAVAPGRWRGAVRLSGSVAWRRLIHLGRRAD